MGSSILGAFDGVKTKKKSKDDLQYIYYKDIRPAPKNRDTGDITELAEDIAEDGLDHNLVLRKIDDEDYKYEIVAGHRRYLAICFNIQNGDSTYEYVPCKIKDYDDMNNINTKSYTPGEMLMAVEDLKEVYRVKKERGEKVPGRVQELIAKDTGLGKTQVGNYEKVINNAIDPVKEMVKNDEITLNEALKISDMDEENQMKFIEDAEGDISLTTIGEFQSQLEEDEDTDYYEETEDYGNHDVIDQNYQETVNDNVDSVKNNSVQGLVLEIETHLELLNNKISGSEWKNEQQIIEEIKQLVDDFKHSAGIA